MSGGGHLAAFLTGFTLAEVLVTLGIIGVVSAMTIPTLMQNHQRKVYVTQLHKVYNELQQTFIQYMTDRNAINLKEAGITSVAALNAMTTQYFRIVESCTDASTVEPCFENPNNYRKLDGASAAAFDNTGSGSFVLASGAVIRPWLSGSEDNAFIVYVVDINGRKGPNIFGRDFFDMCVDVNGRIDTCSDKAEVYPLSQERREELFEKYCSIDSTGNGDIRGCLGKILNDNWVMTY